MFYFTIFQEFKTNFNSWIRIQYGNLLNTTIKDEDWLAVLRNRNRNLLRFRNRNKMESQKLAQYKTV